MTNHTSSHTLQFWLLRILVFEIVIICMLFINLQGVGLTARAQSTVSCIDFRNLRGRVQPTIGAGKALNSGEKQTINIDAVEAGTRWVFRVQNEDIGINISPSPETLPVQVILSYQGKILHKSTEHQIVIPAAGSGNYTLTVERADGASLGDKGSVEVTVENSTLDNPSLPRGYQLNKRDSATSPELDRGSNLQKITLSDVNVQVATDVDAVSSIETGPYTTVSLKDGRVIKVASRVISAIEINDDVIHVTGNENNDDVRITLQNASDYGSVDFGELREFSINQNLQFKSTGLMTVDQFWIGDRCAGLHFRNGTLYLTKEKNLMLRSLGDAANSFRLESGQYSVEASLSATAQTIAQLTEIDQTGL